jgi:pyrrolysyl-tRNA synthetase-like protein
MKVKCVRKRQSLAQIVGVIRLWPSRSGVLHGVRSVRVSGNWVRIETHCGQCFMVRDSRTSRGHRHLTNKIWETKCPKCRIPAWKAEKFNKTEFV